MHFEIQVALNFVISYLYNKLPRRRVNIFGEELEKALCDKFQGHWYPEKPFKGSAYRCLKTGDPIDSVLGRAARESGVPITDIIENLPNELSMWVDPGEVSYRIGEKGAVRILFTESNDNYEDSQLADREVTKTFNPEAQCFRPIDVVNTTMKNLSFALPLAPSGSSPQSAASSSPTHKGSPNPNGGGSSGASVSGSNNVSATATAAAFLQRDAQAPLTFTTATFAQTKFGSTKLKICSKRTNSSFYRMSPTEFSNYIKQRAMQQQLHNGQNVGSTSAAAFGVMESVSPARLLSPNPLALGGTKPIQEAPAAESIIYRKMSMGLFPRYNRQRNLFEPLYNTDAANITVCFGNAKTTLATGNKTFTTYLEPCYFKNDHGYTYAAGAAGDHQQLDHANSRKSCFLFDANENITSADLDDACNSASDATIGGSSNDSSPIATPQSAAVPSPSTVATANETTVSAAGFATANTTASGSVASSGAVNHDSTASEAANNKISLSSFFGTGSSYKELLVAN